MSLHILNQFNFMFNRPAYMMIRHVVIAGRLKTLQIWTMKTLEISSMMMMALYIHIIVVCSRATSGETIIMITCGMNIVLY